MKLVDKLKDYFTISEEEYYDDVEQDSEDDLETFDTNDKYEDFVASRNTSSKPNKAPQRESSRVVDFNASATATTKPHVVFAQLSRFDDVGDVASNLSEKRIVILNLENADERETRRIIDFLYGVIFALGGKIKRVATRTFVITPHNIPFTGELLDEISGGSTVTLFE
ncbi:MAG: cell division protein SepF [Clostridia bacterium]|nr:cell division protein SepF [Clostridia bacterium]